MPRYIDANNLILELESLKVYLAGMEVFKNLAKSSVLRVIDEQPTADVVEVKHGEWIETGDRKFDILYAGRKCSECGYVYCGDTTNYCSRCGAKMDGKQEE